MKKSERALREAAATIPAEICARFETAPKLSDEDRKVIIELARQALAPFQPKPEAKPDEPEQKTEKKPAPEGKDGKQSESKPDKSTPAATPGAGQKTDSKPELKTDPKPAPTNGGKPDAKARPENST